LAWRNPNGVHGWKLELDYILRQHGIAICVFTQTHLKSGETFLMVNYVGHRTERLSDGGGRDIQVRRGIDHDVVTVQILKNQEPTAIQDRLTSKTVKVLAVYPSPSLPLIA
jgi:hypothetical protein